MDEQNLKLLDAAQTFAACEDLWQEGARDALRAMYEAEAPDPSSVILVLDGNVINPKLLSSNVEVHPLLVFVAMIAGSEVGGLVGMLVAVPLAALLKIEFDKFIDAKEAEKKRLAKEKAKEKSK